MCKLIGIGKYNTKTIKMVKETSDEKYNKYLKELCSEYDNVIRVEESNKYSVIKGSDELYSKNI